jgi:hypothetical protein
MPQINSTLERLKATGELSELLDAARDAFSLLLDTCQDSEQRATESFAAFAFAAAAAAEGWLIVDSAPALPTGPGTEASDGLCVTGDLERLGDDLAELAQALGSRLLAAARQAHDPGDWDACEQAAAEAARIYQLLARDPR